MINTLRRHLYVLKVLVLFLALLLITLLVQHDYRISESKEERKGLFINRETILQHQTDVSISEARQIATIFIRLI